ncbi:aspartate carbamoyltransferase regulatory subunit [Candidatus Woesearchaeota archaeon]|nr:aspartate carbamoyltransferase regulatory subunit [Candidatus Woesearchaeota archaeon]
MKDVISMQDFSKQEILAILNAADEVKKAVHEPKSALVFREKYQRDINTLLEGIKVACLFGEKSTRTNYSFRVAAGSAGAYVDGFSSKDDTSLAKGETWGETFAMFGGWGYDAIIMRTTEEGLPKWIDEYLTNAHQQLKQQHELIDLPLAYRKPLILNGGDGKNQHPTQCFLDLYTLRELARAEGKELDGLELALLNDLKYSRVIGSLMSVAHLFDWKLHLAHADRFGPQPHRLEELLRRGVSVTDYGPDFKQAMAGKFAAIQSRPQKERVGKGEDFAEIKKIGQITRELYDSLGEQAPYLLHPLPIDAEEFEEISAEMIFHPKNMMHLQASNGIYVRKALIALGVGRMKLGHSEPGLTEERGTTIQDIPKSASPKEIDNPASGFIRGNGIVLDHIPAGWGRRLEGILGLEGEGIFLVGSYNMPVAQGRKPCKDMLKIHQQYNFSPEQLQALAVVAPDITITEVKNGEAVRKFRPQVGNYINGRVKCGNDACITNVKKEHITTQHKIEEINGERVLTCHYCEVTDTIPKIYQEQRFIYIGK